MEAYHLEMKQTCGIERSQARSGRSQRNPMGLAILTWLEKHRLRVRNKIILYRQDWEIIKASIAHGIRQVLAHPLGSRKYPKISPSSVVPYLR